MENPDDVHKSDQSMYVKNYNNMWLKIFLHVHLLVSRISLAHMPVWRMEKDFLYSH